MARWQSGRQLGQFDPTSSRSRDLIRKALRNLAFERQGGLCYYCERPMASAESLAPTRCTLEHLVEQSAGGEDTVENTAAACAECNNSRPSLAMLVHANRYILHNRPSLARTYKILAEEKWQAEVAERARAYAEQMQPQAAAADDADNEGACDDAVSRLSRRGVQFRSDPSSGARFRIIDPLSDLYGKRLIEFEEVRAGRIYARLYAESQEILQPWMQPHEMMEWRMERMFALRDLQRDALQNRADMIAVCDAVCGRGEWLVGRGQAEWERAALLKFALRLLNDGMDEEELLQCA